MMAAALALALTCLAHAEAVKGRYVYYGNGLSSVIGLAEFEVWSGAKNVLAGRPDIFTLHCHLDDAHKAPGKLAPHWRNLTDGNTNTLDKWPKTAGFAAKGYGGYSDGALSLCAFEADLGETMPIERVEVYRSRIRLENGQPWKLHQDLGWRYVLVLDEQRRIVAWDTFNAYGPGWLDVKKGHWTIVPKPAEGAPAGRVVPADQHSWLSEAEFIRDFLGKPVVDLSTDLTAEDRSRLERFQRRDDPRAVRKLGEEFFRIVDLGRPGLKQVKALVARGKYAEALEAFKAPFFETLTSLDHYYGKFEYRWEYAPDSRTEMRARDLANCVYADKKALSVKRFIPGLLPPAKLTMPSQTRPLLLTYAGTSEAQYLRAWEAMTDDWALGFQEAADRDPSIRQHFVLIGGAVCANLMDLLNASRDNPEFVRELSGATLARYLMPILEEMPVSIWRVCRTCVFNHTYNAMRGGWAFSQALMDFRAGQRLGREIRQGVLRLHTLAQYRDGPMVELGDEGHFAVAYGAPSLLYGQLCSRPPDWFTTRHETYLLDNLRQNELAAVRHTAPSGVGIRWAARKSMIYPGMGGRGDTGPGEALSTAVAYLQRLSVVLEPECRAAISTVYGPPVVQGNKPTAIEKALSDRHLRRPTVLSDWLPYAGAWYFRGGWDRESSFLHMLKPAIANNYGGGFYNVYLRSFERFNPTSYRFTDYATPLLTVFGAEIDKQRPCDKYGRYPSGSKQEAFTRAAEKPQPMRWFTDETLDFGEAVYEGVYHNIYRYRHPEKAGTSAELTYEDDPVTIHGARAIRQIIQVRPARLFLQIERIRYGSPDETHTNRFPVTLMLTEPGKETGKTFSSDQLQIDEKSRTVKTRNPGSPGVTIAWFGQPDLSFKPYSVNASSANFWPQPDPEVVDPKADARLSADSWGNGWDTLNGNRRTSGRGVFASWTATGESVVLAALRANAPGEELILKQEDLSTDTVAGLRVTTRENHRKIVHLLVARKIPATLEAGPVAMEGEALLLVENPRWNDTTVLVLGAKRLTVAGSEVTAEPPDLTFRLASSSDQPSAIDFQAIRRPLDPPKIGPAVNTFTESTVVTLNTTSSDAIIRYTTDVPASRMNELCRAARKVLAGALAPTQAAERLALREEEGAEWKKYTGPFRITEDTLVRARTFRSTPLTTGRSTPLTTGRSTSLTAGPERVTEVPSLRAAGTDVSAISYGFFHRREAKPAQRKFLKRMKPGLNYDYLEGNWFALWTYADVLPAKKTGTTTKLLDVSMRETDDPFAVRYNGYIEIPLDGVHTFYGPNELIDNICAPGYDLRVYVDGEEWDLGQTWHGRGMWSVPLVKGLHHFMMTFADARAKDLENQRIDLAMHYPYPQTTWKGVAPVLEMSGPGLKRQPVPNAWLRR